MDLETENRIAAILMKEAAELRRRAAEEGALAYLSKPSIRSRPNSRFLTATVLGVQQSNKAVEVSELWRIRQKERDLDNRLKRSEDGDDRQRQHGYKSKGDEHDSIHDDARLPSSSRGPAHKNHHTRDEGGDEGFRDEEVEEFLHSRVKRGRGAIGSRMDEAGPYLPSSLEDKESSLLSPEVRRQRVAFGPEKPSKRIHSGTSNRDAHEDEKDQTSPRKKHESERKSKSKKLKGKKRRKD